MPAGCHRALRHEAVHFAPPAESALALLGVARRAMVALVALAVATLVPPARHQHPAVARLDPAGGFIDITRMLRFPAPLLPGVLVVMVVPVPVAWHPDIAWARHRHGFVDRGRRWNADR